MHLYRSYGVIYNREFNYFRLARFSRLCMWLISQVPGGGGVLPEKFGRGVWPASQNPYPIYDQNLRFSLPYL